MPWKKVTRLLFAAPIKTTSVHFVVPGGTIYYGGNAMAIVSLIESGLGLIATATDITPQWVEGVLRGSGNLEDNVTVTDVSIDRLGEGVGIMSILQRITPT